MTQEILNNSPLPEEPEANKMTKMETLIREIEKVKRKIDTVCEIRQQHIKEMENLKKTVGKLCSFAQSHMSSYYREEKDYKQADYWFDRRLRMEKRW